MKKSIAAVIYHCSEADTQEDRHTFCPRDADSWCKYNSDKVTEEKSYRSKLSIKQYVSDLVKPIIGHENLSSVDLLTKCFHGATQNPNESINNLIWQKCSKRVYSRGSRGGDMVTCHYLIFPSNYSSHNPRRACTPTSRYSHFPIYTIPYILTSFQFPHFPYVDLNLHTTITNHCLFLINA